MDRTTCIKTLLVSFKTNVHIKQKDISVVLQKHSKPMYKILQNAEVRKINQYIASCRRFERSSNNQH